MPSISDRVMHIVSTNFGCTPTLDTKLVADLDADSLDLVEIEMDLEHEFNIDIDGKVFDDKPRKSVCCEPAEITVADLVAIVEKAVQ